MTGLGVDPKLLATAIESQSHAPHSLRFFLRNDVDCAQIPPMALEHPSHCYDRLRAIPFVGSDGSPDRASVSWPIPATTLLLPAARQRP